MRVYNALRQELVTAVRVGHAPRVPPPRGPIKTPTDFLNAIGRDHTKKLASPSSGWLEWDDMWTTNSDALKTAGVPVKDRRYFMWCLEKYRLGHSPEEFAHPAQPKKKYRGWGPKVQHGKRIR